PGGGDDRETAERLPVELHPPHFLETLHRLIMQAKYDRNSLYSQVYIRPDYVWLVVPEALRVISTCKKLSWDTGVVSKMRSTLRSLPQVEPASAHQLASVIMTRPDSRPCFAVRIRPGGFLSESELGELGFHEYEIKVLDAGLAAAASPYGAHP